jgi:hypothetical protein
MSRPTKLFAERIYQTAFDRGAREAVRRFERLRAARGYLPADWSSSREEAAALIEDLLPPDLPTSERHLAVTCAYSGAWLQWRRNRAAVTSGVMHRVEPDELRGLEAPSRRKWAAE